MRLKSLGRTLAAGILPSFLAYPAPAQPQDEAAGQTQASTRTINIIVYGDDACPEPDNSDEIVVCGRRPESDRYRIPKALRGKKEESGAMAWTTQMEMLDQDMRYTRPNSCSAVGSGGMTGCVQQSIDQWRAERRGH
ncbi:MAG TPA: hypothetical protein VI381_04100 [Allosphingosinicella sp.]